MNKKVGSCKLNDFNVVYVPSFTEYLRSGWNIKLHIAIDYTASNGDLSDPRSLHQFSNGGVNNQYLGAINNVGQILEEYSTDK